GELACRRGVYHVAREEARYREEAGHYMPGDFAEAADRATSPEDSDPCYLRKCISTKTRGGYDLPQAERAAIRQVGEVHPEWHPQEPRPLVVFSEWQLPHDIFGYSPEYYYQFRFRMTTRDDLFLDAVPMVWGPDKVPPVTCVEAEAGRRSSSSRRLRGVVLVLPTCDTNVSRLHQQEWALSRSVDCKDILGGSPEDEHYIPKYSEWVDIMQTSADYNYQNRL
ncbi:hypothetical protein TNCV_2726731, partial [Trichonephila clavipes]